ncbi:MAG: four helix bundle protein [Chitinophagales bacterium]
MKDQNILQRKSFAFAIRIVKAYKYLRLHKSEFVISKQLLRSGTSICANVEEAVGGQSKADFLSKISIAYKESRETLYWLRLLKATNYINLEGSDSLIQDAEELCRIIGKIQVTLKSRNS